MNHTGEIIRGVIALLLLGTIAGWIVVKTVTKAEEPVRMLVKWVFTALVLAFMFLVVGPMMTNPRAASYSLLLVGVCAAAMIITWRRSIADIIANPIGALYDGGSDAPDPHPFYSVARARQKQGRYLEAVDEVRKQLKRFPADVEGQMLLAEIQAEKLHDLPAAQATIDQFCEQPGHAPQNITFALYSMADWYLQVGKDRQGAQRALEKIIEMLPDTEFGLGAAQRIAHLATTEMLLGHEDRKRFVVPEGPRRLGLSKRPEQFRPTETDPSQVAAEYVRHLEQHPLDTEVRGKLAVLYADHYQRLDLATDELEQMIAHPNQPARLVVHWLNLLADLQVRAGADLETVTQTLQRIIDRSPKLAAAEIARKRLALLKLELKANEKSEAVKLGAYDQDIGLRHGPPAGLYGGGKRTNSPRR